MRRSILLSALIVGMFGFTPASQALETSNLTLEDAYETRGGKWNGRPGLRRYSDGIQRTIYRKKNSSRALSNPFRSRTQNTDETEEETKKLQRNTAERIKDKVGKKKTRRISIRTKFQDPAQVNNTDQGEKVLDREISLDEAYQRSNRRRNLQPGVARYTRERQNRNTYTSPRNSSRNVDRRRSTNNRSATTRKKAERRSFLQQKFNRYRQSSIGGDDN